MVALTRLEHMHAVLGHFVHYFWLSLMMTVIYSGLLFIVSCRRDLYLRCTAAEAGFWHRLGFPSRRITDASRRLEESRAFVWILWFIVVACFVLMVLNAGMYFHFKHRFHSTPPSNQAMQRTAGRLENHKGEIRK